MMYLHAILSALLITASGAELEMSGQLVEAGRTYMEDGNIPGEIRILTRFLEESLYSGRSSHAFEIILQLEDFELRQGCIDFWYARLAWSCGLSGMACSSLDAVEGSQWLVSRAAGLAAQYRGDADEAVELFVISMEQAESIREKYYSALDLSFALIQRGEYAGAEEISSYLALNFPGEGLPLVALALSLQGQDKYGQAMSILQDITNSAEYSHIARLYASSILEDLE